MVAVSQQTPDNSLETQQRNGLSFASLVDAGGRVAHAFDLRWRATHELRTIQESSGADLTMFNGEPSWTLTMPARYVVAASGTIEYADISVDYTRRGEPSELLPVLAHSLRISRTIKGSRKRVRAFKPMGRAIPTRARKWHLAPQLRFARRRRV